MKKQEIQQRQQFLDIYTSFNEWLRGLGFRTGHYWKESATALDYNYWNDIDSLYGVEHYINDTLNLAVRFLRCRDKHCFFIVNGLMVLSDKLNLNEMRSHILLVCQNEKERKIKEIENLNI